jgi:P27 family predicted phage terminase small subunit
MGSGGARVGAGRKKKPVEQTILEGNAGKRPIKVLDFNKGVKLPNEPPSYLSEKAKEVYTSVWNWLDKIGCLEGIMPYHLEEYAACKARWFECETMNTKHGLIIKNANGSASKSPYVQMAQEYLRQTNEVWAKIYIVVRESKLKEWDNTNPNDDVMERLLSLPPKRPKS